MHSCINLQKFCIIYDKGKLQFPLAALPIYNNNPFKTMGIQSSRYYQRTKPRKDSIQGWNCSVTLLSIEGGLPVFEGDFEDCSYHDQDLAKHFNKEVRDCLKQSTREERFTKATEPILRKYFESHQHKLASRGDKWDIYRYETYGLFQKHRDRQLKPSKSELVHVATELLLPPKSLCPYKGGDLVIYEQESGWSHPMITADERKWTHVILPLGIFHEVRHVMSNFRISCSKEVAVERVEGMSYSVPVVKKAPEFYTN